MKVTLLIILSLVFSGCTEKECKPKTKIIQPEYPRMKTLYSIDPYTPRFVLQDGVITMAASELSEASEVSQKIRKQNIFYVRQALEYNRRFVDVKK